jgi:hypothetical protein
VTYSSTRSTLDVPCQQGGAVVAWFASLEEAMENPDRQDTTEMAQRMAALGDERTFRNFDVVSNIDPSRGCWSRLLRRR